MVFTFKAEKSVSFMDYTEVFGANMLNQVQQIPNHSKQQ